MIKFYSSHCPTCKVLKMAMDRNNIEYEEINDEDIYMKIANEHGIASMPFADINGEIFGTTELRKYLLEGRVK